ncbi:MAG: LPS export ABC transporter permease LptG [Candidatus Latescibacterota bacterium]|nr:MAG: LPS export ABC transporter permease LptG [Candidatus Latescibacterota bacterium]
MAQPFEAHSTDFITVRIHDRYLLRQFIRIFFFSVLSFTIIYITIDVFEEIDNFIDHEADFASIGLYYLYSIPFILTYIIPVSLLLGAIFSMGIMGRRNELTALISSGISLVRIAAPVLITAIVVSFLSTGFNDYVVTKANRRGKDVKRHDIEGRARSDPRLKENFHYLGENGFVYLARRYNHETQTLFDVVVQQFDRNTLLRRIDAKKATWVDGEWIFHSGFERIFESESEEIQAFEELQIAEITERPSHFAKEQVDQENMNFKELRSYIDKVKRSGGSVERYLTDLYFKFSYPLAGSIFVLLGIALSSGKRKQSIATGFGLTLLISFLYYGVLRIGQTLGYNGVVPPLLAAELGNIVFLIIGAGLIVRANR